MQEMQAQDQAFSKQYDAEQAQKAAVTSFSGQAPGAPGAAPGDAKPPQQSVLQKWGASLGHVTTQLMDSAVSDAQLIYDTPGMQKARDITAGVITGATNIADAGYSLARHIAPNFEETSGNRMMRFLHPDDPQFAAPAVPDENPMWTHAKDHINDFRDAVQIQDPGLSDRLIQGGAQLAIPFAGYSRLVGGLGAIGRMVTAGALTDASALQPHDARLADLLALGRHTEGKLGEALRTLAPDGSAFNAYINYLTDRSSESEASGRLKNVLDGFGANLIVTPLLHGAASVLKQGTAGLRYLMENGVTSSGGMVPSPAMQRGGPAAARQSVADPAEEIATQQAREDMARAAANPNGKRPPLNQSGVDPAQPLIEQHVREDVDRAHQSGNLESLLDHAPSDLEKDPALSFARTHTQSHMDAGSEQPTHELVSSLAQHLDSGTEEGAFYKNIFQKLADKQQDTQLVQPGTSKAHAAQNEVSNVIAGRHSVAEDTTTLYRPAFKNNANFARTLAHEQVHAATMSAIDSMPKVHSDLSAIMKEAEPAIRTLKGSDQYGLKDPKEFVAEVEANPRVQQALKGAKAADGRPLWDHYKEVVGSIFGISGAVLASPHFEKLLTKEKSDAGT